MTHNPLTHLTHWPMGQWPICSSASATAHGGNNDYVSIEYSAYKRIGGVTGYFQKNFRQIDIPFLQGRRSLMGGKIFLTRIH